MHTIKRIGQAVLFGGIIFLFFILVFQNRLDIPSWLKIAGRMHPMFLHFPIVLLLLSFISLWIPFHERNVWHWFDGVRLIAALSAVLTAIMGLLLSVDEERTGQVLEWHKWSGISVAVFGAAFYTFDSFFLHRQFIGKGFTVIAALTILVAGHWGADLTHGENYLLAPLTADKKVPLEEAMVFQDVVKPILDNKCVSCHGEASSKGGLVLDKMAELMKGGKTGPLYVPGQPGISLLMKRIHLPKDDKKHMPPKSKPELADDEIALLDAWIRSGAVLNKKVLSLPAKDSFRVLATRFLGSDEDDLKNPEYRFPPADNKTITALNTNYRVIKTLGMGSPALSVHFYGKTVFTPKSLEEILPIKDQVTELSLARMPLKDEDLKLVGQMPNLQKLNLNYTDITGKGLGHLSGLKNLDELSLSGTAIKPDSLARVLSLPQLRSIYLWNTPLDSIQIAAIRGRYKNVRVESGYVVGAEEMIALSPPVVKTTPGIFDQPLQVVMRHPIANVEIRYTLDGTLPDSVKSPLYKEPLKVDNDVMITARAFKVGWYGSNEVRASYIRKGFPVDSIEVVLPVDPKYKSAKATLLTDGDLGDIDFENGQWLGYLKNNAEYLLYFEKPVTIQNVLVNTLQYIGAYIFPPPQVEVWGGMEKNSLKELGKVRPSMPVKDGPPIILFHKVEFAATQVKYVKIVVSKLGRIPPWHPDKKIKEERPWVYVSEVVVN